MGVDRHPSDGTREVRLEGVGLVVIGGVLLAGIVGAFFLGRWVERRAHPPAVLGADQPGPLSQVVEVDQLDETAADANHFDAVGKGTPAEPARELAAEPGSAAKPATPAPDAAEEEPSGPRPRGQDAGYYVQVFAGRDRSTAETLVNKLKTQGYEVRVFSEREGQGALFKVRVGGYPTEERARLIASDLRSSGYEGAWVTRSE